MKGWWLVAVEVLAVVILLVLAEVTGRTARGLSQRIDNRALADLVRFDYNDACINGAQTLRGWWRAAGHGGMAFLPTFTWPNGTEASCSYNASHNTGKSMFPGHNSSRLLDDMTLAAMYRCGVLTGFARSDAAADAIENGSAEKLPRTMSWRGQLYQILVFLSSKRIVLASLLRTEPADLLCETTLLGTVLEDCDTFWAGMDFFPRQWNESLWDSPPEVSLFAGETCIEPSNCPHQRVVRRSAPTLDIPQAAFLWFGPQNTSTAACMAQHAPHDVDSLPDHSSCAAPVHTQNSCAQAGSCTARDLNVSVSGLEISWINEAFKKYECADGIDITSPNASAALAKLSAYKDRAKAGLTTVLFWSMSDQSYDDVYAVYTGILGALFGAFVLLVTTLFVYAVAAVKRTCACFEQPAEPV